MDNWIELLFDGGGIATGLIAGIVAALVQFLISYLDHTFITKLKKRSKLMSLLNGRGMKLEN